MASHKRQIHHTPGLAHCRCLSRNSKSVTRSAMIPLSAAALAYARQPFFFFGAHFQRREAAHWAIGRLQAISG